MLNVLYNTFFVIAKKEFLLISEITNIQIWTAQPGNCILKTNKKTGNVPFCLAYVAPPLSEEKNTRVLLSIFRLFREARIFPTAESNSLTTSPYLQKIFFLYK